MRLIIFNWYQVNCYQMNLKRNRKKKYIYIDIDIILKSWILLIFDDDTD